jgi:putative transposase
VGRGAQRLEEDAVRGPRPPRIERSAPERDGLDALIRRHGTPQQLALRARIVLAAADGANHSEIARQEGVALHTVRLWRRRWQGLQAVPLTDLSVEDRLSDAPRAGKPPRITAEQVCRIVALACEAPERAGRPISQWTARELAAAIQARGIVEAISPRHAARLLKRGTSNRI